MAETVFAKNAGDSRLRIFLRPFPRAFGMAHGPHERAFPLRRAQRRIASQGLRGKSNILRKRPFLELLGRGVAREGKELAMLELKASAAAAGIIVSRRKVWGEEPDI